MLSSAEQDGLNFSNAYHMFTYSMRSEVTRRYYERRLYRFFDFIQFETNSGLEQRCNNFAVRGKSDINWALNKIMTFLQFQKDRSQRGEITPGTLGNLVKAIKLFCEMSDVQIPWKKITRGLPRIREAANDRAPTVEETRKLIEYPDRRIKTIILVMASSGIRIGAWDYLKWKHVTPIKNEAGQIIAAKIIVYAGDVEEYYSFITPEAFDCLGEWMDFRASYGERVTEDSWLMRDLWQITNADHGKKNGLAEYPKKLKSSGIKSIIERALWEQGLRKPLPPGQRRHEWKGAHGFRKFYKTHAEQVMKPINVEITMGHNIGLSSSYYKPTQKEVLDDYLKAVEFLTVNNLNRLQEKIVSLEEKHDDITLMKLERQREMKMMREEMQSLLSLKNVLIREGILKESI
ncbi:MAG: hypothetical protein ACHQ1D_08650 [Nitrososphaerales archaeon]